MNKWWVFKARRDLWYFTKEIPVQDVTYYTFSLDMSGYMTEHAEGSIGLAKGSGKVHSSFRAMNILAIAT